MVQSIFDKLRLFKHFFSSARRRGFRRTVQIALYEMWFERKFGAGTGVVIPAARLDYGGDAKAHAESYFPSSYLFLHESLAVGPLNCTGEVFVDYGCGMGRALLFASTLPFRRIIGVELSPSLCQRARENLQEYYRRRNKAEPSWIIVNADARLFDVPDDATVFYFANPFDDTILNIVLDNILVSIQTNPRTCYVVYANPIHEVLLKNKGLSKLRHHHTIDYVIYKAT